MLEESDGYIDLLDWNNLLDKNKNLSDAFVTKGTDYEISFVFTIPGNVVLLWKDTV